MYKIHLKYYLLFGTISNLLMSSQCNNSKEVTLNLRGMDCSDSCYGLTDETECLSSIRANGIEHSTQDSGLNVAVIDSYTGEVIQTKNFDRLGGIFSSFTGKKKKFLKYFQNIKNDSVIVLVSQDTCSLYFSTWYDYLIRNTGNIFKNNTAPFAANVGIVVGCKGECPITITGSLPYTYFGYDVWYTKEIKFLLKEKTKPTSAVVDTSSNSEDTKPLIIGITVTISLLGILFIAIAIYLRRSNNTIFNFIFTDDILSCYKIRRQSKNNNDVELSANDIDPTTPQNFDNASYNKQQNIISLAIEPCTNGAPSYAGYRNINNGSGSNEYQSFKKNSVQYDKIDLPSIKSENDYIYIDPNEKEASNCYYEPVELNLKRSRSETQLTDLSSSPGTSHKMFQKSTEQTVPGSSTDKNQFASYVTIDNENSAVYKLPSNAPKFKAPLTTPKNLLRDSYCDMGTSNYDNSEYQSLSNTGETEETYEPLLHS